MCDPISAAGVALSAAGGLAQGVSNQNYVNTQNRANREAYAKSSAAREAERARQKGFEGEAISAWDKSLTGLSPDDQNRRAEDAVKAFMAAYDTGQNDKIAGQFLSGQELAGDAVKTDIAKQTAEAAADVRKRITALAGLSSYGNVETGNRIAIGDTNSLLTTLNGIRRGSLGVAQQEQSIQPASVSPGTGGVFGQILSGLGGAVAGMGGGTSAVSAAPGAVPASNFRMGFATPGQRD